MKQQADRHTTAEGLPLDTAGSDNRPDDTTVPELTLGSLSGYGVMAFPLAFAGLPIYLHAPDFYALTLQLPLTALGTALLALRLVDAIQDPLIGSLSDRFHRWRHLTLLLGAFLLGAGFWMLFHPVEQSPMLWFTLSVLICTTGYSIVAINFQTLGGLWRASSASRTRITASREAYGLIGLLVASVIPPVLTGFFGTRAAFHWLALGYLPLLAIACWLLFRWMRTAPLIVPSSSRISAGWVRLMTDRWRATFFSLVLLNTFASAIPAVLVLFFVRDRLGAESYTGLFLLIYFLSGAASLPLWTRVAGKYGKLRAWQMALATAVVTFCWAGLLAGGDVIAYALVCALSGFALGADLALPPAILADHIEADDREWEASRLFSVMAFVSKLSLAAATGLTLPLLGFFGYHPGGPMTPDLGLLLSLTYAGLPCVLKLIALAGLLLFHKDLARNR